MSSLPGSPQMRSMGRGGVDIASPSYLDFVTLADRYPPGHPLHGAVIYGRRGGRRESSSSATTGHSNSDDSDSMPPLEEIDRPINHNPTAAAAPASLSEVIAKLKEDDSDDDDSVEIVDQGAGAAGSSTSPARRTRSHVTYRSTSVAAAAAAAGRALADEILADESAYTSAAAAASVAVDMSVASPSPARRKPSGGLKTTGLDSEDSTTPTKKPATGKKRSADEVDGTPKKKGEGTDDNTDDADADKKKEAEQHCSICLDVPSREEVTKLNKCEHVFCFGCIETWADRENTCPLCKVRFTKIERVNKPPPSKRRKKGGGGRKSSGAKATKRIKTRDQREDLVSANPLEGLFAHLEESGTMPRSIAQLIFSGLAGPNPFAGPRRFQTAARQRNPATHRSDSTSTQSYTVARDPTTGRFVRVPREPTPSSAGSSSPAAPAAASSGTARRSTRTRNTARNSRGPAASSSTSGAAAAASSSSRSARAGRSGSSAAPQVSVTLNSFGPTSFNLSRTPSPGSRRRHGMPPPLGFRSFFQDSDDDDDDYEPPFARAGGYDSFVRRARAQQGRAHSPSSSPFGEFLVRREARMPPTQAHLAPANTADTAIEIGDSDDDDDDEVVVLE